MYVEDEVGVVETHGRTLAILLVEVIRNGILHAVSHKLRVTEHLAVHDRINRKCRIAVKILLPVHRLDDIVNLVGVHRLEMHNGFQDAYGCPQMEVCLVHQRLVTCKRYHTAANLHVVGTQCHQLLGQYLFKTLESLCNQFKFVHKKCSKKVRGKCPIIFCKGTKKSNANQ